MQTNKMLTTNLYCIVARAQIIGRASILAPADHQTARQRREQISRRLREYLQWVIKLTGKPPTRIAKEIGVAASTLTRVLQEGGTGTFRADTLSKLEEYARLHVGGDTSAPMGPRGLAEEAVQFDAESADPAVSAAVTALIGNREAIPRTVRARALECRGFLPGDIVIVDLGREPAPGDIVWAEVSSLDRRHVEAVMRIYQPPVLASATLDEQLQLPIAVDARVTIKGVVLPHRLRGAPTALIGAPTASIA
jgi:hypothetical protein